MLLAVDVGNTKIKVAVFEEYALIDKFIFDRDEVEKKINKIFKTHCEISQIVLSSVGKEDEDLLLWLQTYADLTVINRMSRFPFENHYASPDTLGVDRMVLSAGAVLSFPDKNRLVIDAGTCVTYDFIDRSNSYIGGAISPGLRLRYESMHNFTAKLPLLYPEMPSDYTGNTTNKAMHSGVINGLLYEIEGFMSRYIEQYGDVSIILTGGDAEFLAKRLKNTIFANSNFLLESLNKLYLYTIKIEND
ncbi:type III pantothenate kinase [Flavobacterium arcticum]|uniref:Type III pantothenate kinase n=1 Tax=Flavobacterium arcticum TaxID=1784713 RepID=A0A345H9V4_9FLAO|nr:type III pantothenate kinase [Flavobacterium arcticum]AXG73364.1 type III pantothenate kinase [Flavobacterium arcticum]KAF2513157.1 type III pantothenate kinase [Flavobacterium arcticum]